MIKSVLRMAYVGVLVLGGLTTAHADTTPPATLSTLETMVTNLGYTTTEDANKENFRIVFSISKNCIFRFYLADKGQTLIMYNETQNAPLASEDKVPLLDILNFGNSSDNYFTAEKYSGHIEIYFNTELSTAALTPPVLRQRM